MICRIYYAKPIQGSVSHVFKIDSEKQFLSWMDWQTYGVQPPRKIKKIEVYEDELPLYLIQWGVRHECYIVLMSKTETPDKYKRP